jgi:MarR family transcriptional regulator, organic hydroperoxide resistance regulator
VREAASDARPGANAPALGPILDFMRLLWAVDHGLQSISKRMEGTAGVTGPQRLVIRIVGQFPGISAGDLAEILHIHPSTLTGVLRRLVSRDELQRRSDPADARRAQFELTLSGQRLNRLRAGTVEAAVQRTLAQLSESKVDVVRQVLTTLAEQMAQPGGR